MSCIVLQVRPTHVKEACRLLNKSIIRVEQPDIQLEEDEENGMPMGKFRGIRSHIVNQGTSYSTSYIVGRKYPIGCAIVKTNREC